MSVGRAGLPPAEQPLAFHLAAANEQLQAVIEAVAGHRASLEAAGFSPTMAEQMAAQYYATLISHFARPRS